MKNLTRQQIVDHVVDYYIVKRNLPGKNPNSVQCYYRFSIPGKKKVGRCAVGCLLDKEQWQKVTKQGGNGGSFNGSMLATIPELTGEDNLNFLRMLQGVHDGSVSHNTPFRFTFAKKLRYFIRSYRLQEPQPLTIYLARKGF